MCNLLSKAQQVRRQLKPALRQLMVQARLGHLLLRLEQVRCLAATSNSTLSTDVPTPPNGVDRISLVHQLELVVTHRQGWRSTRMKHNPLMAHPFEGANRLGSRRRGRVGRRWSGGPIGQSGAGIHRRRLSEDATTCIGPP
jgi:hypothetical protein